jgi:hypothetical protein
VRCTLHCTCICTCGISKKAALNLGDHAARTIPAELRAAVIGAGSGAFKGRQSFVLGL